MVFDVNKRAFHIQRPLACAAFCYGFGIVIGRYWLIDSLWLPWLGFCLAIILTFSLFIYKKPMIYGIGFFLLFSGLLYANTLTNPVLPPEGKYIVKAKLSGLVQNTDDDKRLKALLVDVELLSEQGKKYSVSKAYWSFYPSRTLSLPIDGQHIRMTSTLYHPSGKQNPYGFDFKMYLLQKGISIGLSGAGDFQVTGGEYTSVQNPWLKARLWLSSLYQEAVPIGGELLEALLLGERTALLEDVKNDFRDAGITHVLSVSGLHVGILTFALLFFLNLLGMPAKSRFCFMAILLTLYCFLLNFSAPVFRSAIMSLVFLAATLYHERSDPLTSLALASMIILAVRPLDLFSAGFQLSFLAVFGIFTLGDSLQAIYLKNKKNKRTQSGVHKIIIAYQTTFAASVFTAPIVAGVFHQYSLIGLIFSPLACLAVAILMVYGLILLPIAVFWMPLAKIFALPLSYLSILFTKMTHFMANLPLATIQTAAPGVLVIILLFFMLTLCTRYIYLSRKFRALFFIISLIACIMLNFPQKTGDVRYILFSSGNADAAVIESDSKTYVIDTAEHGGDLGSYLLSRGRAVDSLFISHLHLDHIGGLKSLIDQGVQIKQLLLPVHALETKSEDGSLDVLQYAIESGIPMRFASKDDEFEEKGVRIKVLWPIKGKMYPEMNPNHNSMALLINLNGIKLLTAGDLTGNYELYSAQGAQVLKLAHHGAKGSTSKEYLSAVSPQLTLLSANRNRLPYFNDVLDRLIDLDVPIWSTHHGQAIIMTIKEDASSKIEFYFDRGMQ